MTFNLNPDITLGIVDLPCQLSPSILLSALGVALAIPACVESTDSAREKDRFFTSEAERVEEVRQNRLEHEPTTFLRSQATREIPWQPWSAEIFDHALREQKTVFAMLVDSRFPTSQIAMDSLNNSPSVIRTLKEHYVSTLIDLHAHPEMTLVSNQLALEHKNAATPCALIWLTHQRDPIGRVPINNAKALDLEDVIQSAHETLSNRWRDNPRYIVGNSKTDNDLRRERLKQEKPPPESSAANLREVALGAARQLGSLYDPTSGDMDESGGLLPYGTLQFACSTALDPACPRDLRMRLRTMVEGHLDLLRSSATKDHLDGGYFTARRMRSWALPIFIKDSTTQLEMIIALTQAATLCGRPDYLEEAVQLLAFTDKAFADEQGALRLFQFPTDSERNNESHLWSLEELEEILDPDQFRVARTIFGISRIGNIPFEADPRKRFLNLNTLGRTMRVRDAAATTRIPESRAAELLEEARQRMLAHRQGIVETEPPLLEHARPVHLDARQASALIELGAATRNPALAERASGILLALKGSYEDQGRLTRFASPSPHRNVPARGLDYATLLDAVLRLYRHTPDPQLLVWARRLADEAMAKLKDSQALLREHPIDAGVTIFPTYSRFMLTGHSTWGTIFGPLARLNAITRSADTAETLEEIEKRLSNPLQRNPLGHTDFGCGALVRAADLLVLLDGPKGSAVDALHAVLREPAHRKVTLVRLHPSLQADFDLPLPGDRPRAILFRRGEPAGEASNPPELRNLLTSQNPDE